MMELLTLAKVIYSAYANAKHLVSEFEQLSHGDQEAYVRAAGTVAVHNTLNILSHIQNNQSVAAPTEGAGAVPQQVNQN